MIKVLIVDDSPTIREYLRYIMSTDKDLEVAGVAKDGDEAIRMVRKTCPDVVTMDIQMPRMNGYEATRKIMEIHPLPIVIVSSTLAPEQVTNMFQAIRVGALAVLEKPRGPGHPKAEQMAKKIVQTVKLMSEVKVVTRYGSVNTQRHHKAIPFLHDPLSDTFPGSLGRKTPDPCQGKDRIRIGTHDIKVVAIGASTGGPPVIRTILSNITNIFPVPILFVQHIAPGFLQGMVEWLGKETGLPLHIPGHGEHAIAGHTYFAPDGYHMGISRHGEIVLSKAPPVNSLRPSVSHLFRSAMEAYGREAAGVLLTGMGKDGASELKRMRDKGALTIAQSKESSVVHGMPGEAIRLDAAKHILSPEDIAQFFSDCWAPA